MDGESQMNRGKLIVYGVGMVYLGFIIFVGFDQINRDHIINPCPDGYDKEETQIIDNQLYYRCCKSWQEIVDNKFKENQDCQILKAKPSLWEKWFE